MTITLPFVVEDVLADENQIYKVHLITAAPDENAFVGEGDLATPTEPNYSPQETTGELVYQDDVYTFATLNAVLFDGRSFTDDVDVAGYYVSAEYEDASMPIGMEVFNNSITLGKSTPAINIIPEVEVFSLSDDSIVNEDEA